jgi:hypothetical protein
VVHQGNPLQAGKEAGHDAGNCEAAQDQQTLPGVELNAVEVGGKSGAGGHVRDEPLWSKDGQEREPESDK